MDCIVHGVTKSWTRLSEFHFQEESQGLSPTPILGSQGDEDKARDDDRAARKARSKAGMHSALEAKRRKWFRGKKQLLTDVLEDQIRLII